jgi:hypothetical protein
MQAHLLLYIGSVLIFLWGVAHVVPTRSVVRGFGDISRDNRRILTLEWIAGGMTLVFIGVLVFMVTWVGGPCGPVAFVVHRACAVMLAGMAMLSVLTGARTSILPMKVCPVIQVLTALLFVLGSAL